MKRSHSRLVVSVITPRVDHLLVDRAALLQVAEIGVELGVAEDDGHAHLVAARRARCGRGSGPASAARSRRRRTARTSGSRCPSAARCRPRSVSVASSAASAVDVQQQRQQANVIVERTASSEHLVRATASRRLFAARRPSSGGERGDVLRARRCRGTAGTGRARACPSVKPNSMSHGFGWPAGVQDRRELLGDRLAGGGRAAAARRARAPCRARSTARPRCRRRAWSCVRPRRLERA